MQTQLYAIDDAFRHSQGRYSPAARAAMLKELGYAGCLITLSDDTAWRELPAAVEALDQADLAVVGLIVACDVKEGHVDARLPDAIARLAGRTALLEVRLHSTDSYDIPSSPRAVPRAADTVKRVADMAKGSGLQFSLSARRGCWMQRVEDAVRLMMRVNRPDIAVTFNACDWYAVDGSDLPACLHLALPRMCNVTIGGAMKVGDICVATPLDAGTFDPFHVLGTLERMGYTGPICLDAREVGGDVFANLRRSITAWRDLCGRVARRPNWSALGDA
jgi:sugar phosphate isomerase/epimerase